MNEPRYRLYHLSYRFGADPERDYDFVIASSNPEAEMKIRQGHPGAKMEFDTVKPSEELIDQDTGQRYKILVEKI